MLRPSAVQAGATAAVPRQRAAHANGHIDQLDLLLRLVGLPVRRRDDHDDLLAVR